MTRSVPPLNRTVSETAARKLGRLHQLARYASRVECRTPDFLIIGAQKGGTTSLYSYLTQHPSVFPAIRKEVHFFENPDSRAKGDRWYRSFFPTEFYLGTQERRLGTAVLTGEATTYMPYPRIPEMLHVISPAARLIFLLRDPVARAFSQYMHVRRSYPGFETNNFSDAIRIEAQRIQPDIDAITRDEWHDDVTFRAFSYVRSGLYAEQLKCWLRVFPREHIYVSESERFFRNPDEVLQEVCKFLKLPTFAPDFSEQHNIGGYDDQVTRTDRDFLIRAFVNDRADLQRLLGENFGASWF